MCKNFLFLCDELLTTNCHATKSPCGDMSTTNSSATPTISPTREQQHMKYHITSYSIAHILYNIKLLHCREFNEGNKITIYTSLFP